MPIDLIDQARRYLDKIEPAVSGNGGHDKTYHVAAILIEGFGLSVTDATPLMAEYSQRCQPPWSEREIAHKLESAAARIDPAKHRKLVRNGVRYAARSNTPAVAHHTHKAKPEPKPARYEVSDALEMPDPVKDGCRKLLTAVFAEGEGVRMELARTGSDGRENPTTGGIVLTREEWLRKLNDHNGNPNGFLKTSEKNGIFVSVNPMKIGGTKDKDVTVFRHALLEFDNISQVEQWGIIRASNIPCSAVIASGNKSLHAWVKVDATDRNEFDERVKILYEHFADYKPDPANKNPSRFSRLPNCERGQKRQELLAVDIGCGSFTQWIAETEKDDLGKCHSFSELISVDTKKDPNCVIGFKDGDTLRYLCKGKSAWLIGPSGVGKSSLLAEFAIAWAMGEPAFGIRPAKPLKSLIIQAENDFYDLAEMVQGILAAHKITPESKIFKTVDANVIFKTETTSIREEFVKRMHRLIDRERPDIIWADPLLSFAGIKVTEQDECSMFLRQWINPVLESTGVVLIGIHHTGKPKSQRDTQNWTALDYAYSGLGSSELVNWARAVLVLRPLDDYNFELKLAKRGKRAWATHPDGQFTTSIYLKHDAHSIRWHQCEPPEQSAESEPDKKKGPKSKVDILACANLHEVLSKCPTDGESAMAIGQRLENYSRKIGKTLGKTKCRTDLLDALITNGKLIVKGDLYFKGPNA
jgi:RecA-family ATPase